MGGTGGTCLLPQKETIIQDRDTLIEQSVKYSNRTVTTHNATFIVAEHNMEKN